MDCRIHADGQVSLIHSQAGECFFEQCSVDGEAAAVGLYVFEFVEGAEETELGGGVLLGIVQGAAVGLGPGSDGRAPQERR